MATYYPSCLSQSEYCLKCNTAQNPSNGCTSTRSNNHSSNASQCSAYCNVGCNSSCNQPQTVCLKGTQYIHNHPDVGSYPGSKILPNDFIHEKWTTTFFANLNTKLINAEQIGRLSRQGSTGSFTNPSSGDPVTAQLYNDIGDKFEGFGQSLPTVVQNETVITAELANAIMNAYNGAKFDSSVCDMCNVDQTMRGGCGCNCSCACSCSCGCNCSCPCGNPAPPPNATTV